MALLDFIPPALKKKKVENITEEDVMPLLESIAPVQKLPNNDVAIAGPSRGLEAVPRVAADTAEIVAPTRGIMSEEPPMMPGMVAPQAQPLLPTIPVAPRRQSQVLSDEYNAVLGKDYSIRKDENGNVTHRGADRDKQWSTWDKIGSALLGYAQGGIAGAIQGGTDRNFMEKQADQRQIGRLLPRIEAAKTQEKADQDYQQGVIKTQKDRAEAVKSGLEAIQAQNPLLAKAAQEALQNGVVTPELQKAIDRAGYGYIPTVDNRKFDTKEINGQIYSTPDRGVPNYQTTNAPIDPTKKPIARKLSDGTDIYTTGDKEIDREIASAYRQAQMDFTAGRDNADALRDYEKRLEGWATNESERKLTAAKLTEEAGAKAIEAQGYEAEANELEAAIAASTDDEEKAKLRKEAREAKQKAVKAYSDVTRIKKSADASKPLPKPVRSNVTVSAPNLSSRTVTSAEIDAMVKATGKSRKELEEIAKRDGFTIR